jgi:hypothetical protein
MWATCHRLSLSCHMGVTYTGLMRAVLLPVRGGKSILESSCDQALRYQIIQLQGGARATTSTPRTQHLASDGHHSISSVKKTSN